MAESSCLFEPFKLGHIELKNRIAMAPVGTGYCTHDGYVTDQNIAFYVARSKGGTGLIIVEQTLATDKYATSAGIFGLWSDTQIRGMNQLVEAIHSFGAKVVVQLSPGLGRQTSSRSDAKEVVAPSSLPYFIPEKNRSAYIIPRSSKGLVALLMGPIPRELTITEIVELEQLFVRAATRAQRAGFDGIEIHGAHGYLVAQFVSPLSNNRNDLYGGSLANRLRFPLNLITLTRKALGEAFVIGYRISGDEHVEGGLTLNETTVIVSELAKAGLDYIHLSSGRREAMKWVHPPKEGMMIGEAERIKRAIEIPVICPNIYNPEVATQTILEKKADLVSMGRQLLADPEWPNKVKEDKYENVRKCTRCGECVKRLYSGWKIACPVNRTLGSECYISEYWPPYKANGSEKA